MQYIRRKSNKFSKRIIYRNILNKNIYIYNIWVVWVHITLIMLGHDDELGYMSQKNLSAYILKIIVTYRHRTKNKTISSRRLTNNGDDFWLCNHQGKRNKNEKRSSSNIAHQSESEPFICRISFKLVKLVGFLVCILNNMFLLSDNIP